MANDALKNEILSDEQLENVTGGSWGEFAGDMYRAKARGIAGFENIDETNPKSDLYKMIDDDDLRHQYVNKVANIFAAHGITMEYKGKPLERNIYTYQGKNITQDQAWDIIDGKTI